MSTDDLVFREYDGFTLTSAFMTDLGEFCASHSMHAGRRTAGGLQSEGEMADNDV